MLIITISSESEQNAWNNPVFWTPCIIETRFKKNWYPVKRQRFQTLFRKSNFWNLKIGVLCSTPRQGIFLGPSSPAPGTCTRDQHWRCNCSPHAKLIPGKNEKNIFRKKTFFGDFSTNTAAKGFGNTAAKGFGNTFWPPFFRKSAQKIFYSSDFENFFLK